jgi:hypothetical protein
VDRLEGPEDAKKLLEAILEKLAGKKTADEACAVLGISRPYYYVKENEVLHAALSALLPKPIGRPPAERPGEPPETQELREQLRLTQLELQASRAREQIWATMPEVAQRVLGKNPPKKKGADESR